MSGTQHPTFSRVQAMLAVIFLSFFVGIAFDIAGWHNLYEVTLYASWLLVLPLVFVLNERLPLVESAESGETETNPVRHVRQQYARGEIDEVEFQRRLDRLTGDGPLDDEYDLSIAKE